MAKPRFIGSPDVARRQRPLSIAQDPERAFTAGKGGAIGSLGKVCALDQVVGKKTWQVVD
jgi:hypothetical protein